MNLGKDLPNSRRDLIKWMRIKLKEYNIRLKSRLSQILLTDPKVLRFIAKKASELVSNRRSAVIIEIGAGIGNLTQFLVHENINALIVAVEIDHRFAPILQEIKKTYSNVEVLIGDAIPLLTSMRGVDLAAGNIPYHITSNLLLALAHSSIPCALLTVQKDVAERIVSKPGTKNYGKLSILMQMMFDVDVLRVIPSTLFVPPPRVSSAIIVLKRKNEYNQYVESIEYLTKCLFSYKRKLVSKALTYCLDKKLDNRIEVEGDIWRKRVGQLTVEDLMKLVDMYADLKKRN
ncbi:MAG: 16S rRNA (adenine(1518)-N(6)/adenine(1519)-N(6))-dimethyltransferase RsmA [Ignisphaera sp.]|nr:16S rRNA (adenine(1518)-N(6)/adenine(1519)-N(6))-dimethyltransferase RsmA [Ignisphaera sp.]MDW8085113.1 16S rRNA (adenine(1518)-N(6)/adenine(1519)-N(6))-dimethyltransferase RsmA [Ignisphaera sp.]